MTTFECMNEEHPVVVDEWDDEAEETDDEETEFYK